MNFLTLPGLEVNLMQSVLVLVAVLLRCAESSRY
jgi:hypothetical protein